MARSLFLVVPGIALPGQLLHDLSFDLSLPALRGLLATGQLSDKLPVQTGPTTLLAASVQPASMPGAAALRRIGLGCAVDDAHWLCVDPVHLGFRERSIVVQDPALMQLTHDEARQLAVSLAPTLESFGDLTVDHPLHWHLRLYHPAPAFTPLDVALRSQAISGLVENKAWQLMLNETQMLLHQHPVNLQRVARGLPAVNSIWPWGGGPLPQAARDLAPKAHSLFSNNTCLRGLALYHGQTSAAVPHGLSELPLAETSTRIVVIDALDASASTGDAHGWREGLLMLEERWFAPLLANWQARRQPDLTVHLVFPGEPTSHYLSLPTPRSTAPLRRVLTALSRRLGLATGGHTLNDLSQPQPPQVS